MENNKYFNDDFVNPDYIFEDQEFEEVYSLKSEQFGPFPGGPGRNVQPPSEGPGRNVQPPRSGPPRFMPTMPDGANEEPFSQTPFGSDQFDRGRGGRPGRPGQSGRPGNTNIRRCLNNFTFIWLVNGNSFWFYPVFVGRQQVEGFRWRQGRWEYDRINLRRILFFRCF